MGLVGMKAISAYFGMSEATVLKLHREEGFPMSKFAGGIWHSDPELIEEWRRGRILQDDHVRKFLAKEIDGGTYGRPKEGRGGNPHGKRTARKEAL